MIGDMLRSRPPHLQREKSRHGRWNWYVRVGKGARVRIRAEFGTPEFTEEYQAAIDGKAPAGRRKVRTGSLAWLYERYRETQAWRSLAAATRRQRENIFKHVMETAGADPYSSVTRKSVIAGRDRRASTPSQSRNFLDAMRGLFRWATEAEHVSDDPTAGVENIKRAKGEGFKAWVQEDVDRYIRRWPQGTRQYVWLHVLLYIGSRRGDAVTHGKQHVRDGILSFVTEKGRDKRRIEVARRVEPELAAAIAHGPTSDLAFICGDRGHPFTKESFGNEFKAACVAAGIMDKSAHGLRKLSATIWAERGATTHELMAMFGWLTVQMAEHYTRGAHRKRLAIGAADRLLGTPAEQATPAPDNDRPAPVKISK